MSSVHHQGQGKPRWEPAQQSKAHLLLLHTGNSFHSKSIPSRGAHSPWCQSPSKTSHCREERLNQTQAEKVAAQQTLHGTASSRDTPL